MLFKQTTGGEYHQPTAVARLETTICSVALKNQRLHDDYLRLNDKELNSLEFHLDWITQSECPFYIQLHKLIQYDPSVSNHFSYAASTLMQSEEKEGVDSCAGCLNASSTNRMLMWFTAGALLIDTVAVVCDSSGDNRNVLCTTEMVSLKFGMNENNMGPAVQVGARKPYDSADLCTQQQYCPLAFSTDASAEKASFITDFWLLPDTKTRSVAVVHVCHSRTTVNKNRMIFRETSQSNWKVIQPEVHMELTDGCSFYLEFCDRHDIAFANTQRREVFTFVDSKKRNYNTFVATDMIVSRLYKATVTGQRTATPLDENNTSLLFLMKVRLKWTETKIKQFWGTGINNFNEHFADFGFEYLGGVCDNIKNRRKLHYEIITVDMVRPPPDNTKKSRNNRQQSVLTNQNLFFWAVLEFMYKKFPTKNWVIFEVVGDGNCLFHCVAAWFAVMYPNKQPEEEHYYDWWRQQSCDALVTYVDGNCPHDNSLSILEYFMRQEHCDDSFNGVPPDLLDIQGVDIPSRLAQSLKEGSWQAEESIDDHNIRVAQYQNECIKNRAQVRARYLSSVHAARTAGIFNTEMQLLGVAIACKHVLNVCMFDVSTCEIGRYVTDLSPYDVDVLKEEIYVFYNPFDKAKHYVSVGQVEKVGEFCKPDRQPTKRMIGNSKQKKSSSKY